MLVLQETLAAILHAMKPPIGEPSMRLNGTILQNERLHRLHDPFGRWVVFLDEADANFAMKLAAKCEIELDEVEREGLKDATVTKFCPKRHPVNSDPELGGSAGLEGSLGSEAHFYCAVCSESFPASRTLPG
jgi:hypothetical protein